MRCLFAIAAFLLVSSAAQAQYTFEYGGKTIRIDPDRGTVSIPGVFDNTGNRNKRARSDKGNSRKQTPEQAKSEPQAPGAATAPVPVPAPAPSGPSPSPATAESAASAPAPAKAPSESAPAKPASPEPPPAAANAVPAEPSPPAQSAAAPAQPVQPNYPAAATPAPPVVATAPASPPAPTAAAPAPPKPNSPLGLWLTEEKEGRIRIEQCGANLCGYSVDPKSNQNGEQVLVNMKPGKDSKWNGRIVDPNTGSTYDSTIALKGPDTLRVQGCAFGGMFCGGQTWSRLN